MLRPVTSFAGVDPYPGFGVTEEMTRQVFWPSNVYVTHAFSKDWAVGVGRSRRSGSASSGRTPRSSPAERSSRASGSRR